MLKEEPSSRVRMAGHRLARRGAACVPIGLAAGAGVAVWLVFRPGLLDNDGLQHLTQATNGVYNDWYSPLLPLRSVSLMPSCSPPCAGQT